MSTIEQNNDEEAASRQQAVARLTPDGGLELRVGIQSHGQGLETTLSQVAHEILAGRRPLLDAQSQRIVVDSALRALARWEEVCGLLEQG